MTHTPSLILPVAVAAAVLALAACGGGDDNGSSPPPAAALTCDTKSYVAGSVAAPTATQLATYAATYNGDEGAYGPNPGDPFVKSGTAALVLGADGSVSYKGVAYSPTSMCIDKVAGPFATILYIIAGKGHLDVADKPDATLGSAWGISLADGSTIFTNGLKK